MVIQACIGVVGNIVRLVERPYEEAKRQRQYAFFREATAIKEIEAPSLARRITHIVTNLLLVGLLPGVNAILFAAMRHFGCDSGKQFCQAIEEGDLKQLDFFLQIGWNPNQRFQGKPLLFIAYEHQQHDTVARLLQEPTCDANVYHDGKTLFHLAAQRNDVMTCHLLLDANVNVNAKRSEDYYTPAHIAYLTGNKDLAIEIVERGNCINAEVDQRGSTLFNLAWQQNDTSMIIELIRRGAEPPRKNPLLHFQVLRFVYEKNKDLITRMIAANWDINQGDEAGQCLLGIAVAQRDWTFARKLVESGAHIVSLKPDGTRLISFEQYQNDPDYYRYFLKDEELLPRRFEKLHPRNWLKGETYLKWVMPVLIDRCKKENLNPLEKVYFMNSEVAIQHLARQLTYSEFIHYLTDLRLKCNKRIRTGWIINSLYEISPRHWREFKDLSDESENIGPTKHHCFFSSIPKAFNKISELTEKERTFEGRTYSRAKLGQCLNNLVAAVRDRRAIDGLPKDKRERSKLYDKLNNLLRHIAYNLDQSNILAETKKRVLLDLAYIECCPRDWDILLYRSYCLLTNRDYQILTFSHRVMMELGHFRLELLKAIYKGKRREFKFALSKLADSRKIPKEPPDPEDVPDFDRTQLDEEIFFDRLYTPHKMVKAILEKRKGDQYFRENMINYFKDIESQKWIEHPFGCIDQEVRGVRNPEVTAKDMREFFAKRGLVVPPELDERLITLESALNYERFIACYSTVEPEADPEEALPLGVAKMLESMGHLRSRDPYIFSKSFKKSLYERFVAPYL